MAPCYRPRARYLTLWNRLIETRRWMCGMAVASEGATGWLANRLPVFEAWL
jgi:hypothetical protein